MADLAAERHRRERISHPLGSRDKEGECEVNPKRP